MPTIPANRSRQPLPIDEVLDPIVAALRKGSAVVVRAPTGAGKTTRVPLHLLDCGFGVDGRIVMLEPRRVAARAAARRMASERGETVGQTVGYTVRFERKTSRDTRIEVVTDGILLRRLQSDPFLESVAVVIFDELHERSADAELALAMVRKIGVEVRPDLKIVAMSATIDTQHIAEYLDNSTIVESRGSLHPVAIEHRPHSAKEALEDAVSASVLEALKQCDRDILVFLPGLREIRQARAALTSRLPAGVEVVELYGDLSAEAQDRVLHSSSNRRVILSTNVAESSITIDGLSAIVDSGLVRQLQVDAGTGLNRLVTTRVSRASADQRAGRAGRLGPGVCYRLYSSAEDRALVPQETPEIARVDLAGVALQLRKWGESDLTKFGWLTSPPAESLQRADDLLGLLGATRSHHVTPFGERLSALPLHPRLAAIVAASSQYGHARRLATVAALLSERDPFPRRHHRDPAADTESDLVSKAQALERYERDKNPATHLGTVHPAALRFLFRTRDQLLRLIKDSANRDSHFDADEATQRALLAAFPDRVARRRGGGAGRSEVGVMVGGRGVKLAPSCGVRHAEYFICLDVDAGAHGQARSETLVRAASAVDRAWLSQELQSEVDDVCFDSERSAVRRVREERYLDLTLDSNESAPTPEQHESASALLVAHASQQLDRALSLGDKALRGAITRIQWLREHHPELELPAWEPADFEALLPTLAAGKTSFKELRAVPLIDYVVGGLNRQQRVALESEAPQRWTAPTGSSIAIRYERGKAPSVSIRIQELFGLRETPTLAGGRVRLVLHLLAPNMTQQQVTDDLPSFWANTYPQVRKDLRGRYPKHSWPDNPRDARPQKRPTRKK